MSRLKIFNRKWTSAYSRILGVCPQSVYDSFPQEKSTGVDAMATEWCFAFLTIFPILTEAQTMQLPQCVRPTSQVLNISSPCLFFLIFLRIIAFWPFKQVGAIQYRYNRTCRRRMVKDHHTNGCHRVAMRNKMPFCFCICSIILPFC